MVRKAYQKMDHGQVNRRDFLRITSAVGIGLATCSLGAPLAEAVKFDKELYKVSRSRLGMGTLVSITVLNPSKDHAEEAISAAFREIERLTNVMSRYDVRTPLAELNSAGFLKDAPPELSFVINKSLYYHHISSGFFDITVKPVLDVVAQTRKGLIAETVSAAKIAELLRLVDANKIFFEGKNIGFKCDGMGITLDGIAKGFIVDKAAEKLMEQGVKHALLNAGGDIKTIGDKGNNRPWAIAIEDPLKKNNYPDTISITNGAIATSGNYEIFFDKDKVSHHIVNPATGISPVMSASVSVQAPTAMEADALSTTLFALDPIRGTKLINTLPRCKSLIITRNLRKIKSNGWQSIRI